MLALMTAQAAGAAVYLVESWTREHRQHGARRACHYIGWDRAQADRAYDEALADLTRTGRWSVLAIRESGRRAWLRSDSVGADGPRVRPTYRGYPVHRDDGGMIVLGWQAGQDVPARCATCGKVFDAGPEVEAAQAAASAEGLVPPEHLPRPCHQALPPPRPMEQLGLPLHLEGS
jgi:hypothetical protein